MLSVLRLIVHADFVELDNTPVYVPVLYVKIAFAIKVGSMRSGEDSFNPVCLLHVIVEALAVVMAKDRANGVCLVENYHTTM